MSRRALGLVLLVSLGVNVGVLATLAVDRLRDGEAREEPSGEPAPEGTASELSDLFDPAVPQIEEPDGPRPEDSEPPELEEPAGSEPEPETAHPEPTGVEEATPAGTASGEAGVREPGLGEPTPFDPGPGGRPLREAGEPREIPQQIGWRLEALADRLGLAGEPRREFLEVQRGFFRDTFVRRQEIHRLQRAVRQELTSPRPDRRRLAEATERLAAAREELDRTFIQAVLDTRQILDPAQEREYLRFLARLRAASEGRREAGPSERPGPRKFPPGT